MMGEIMSAKEFQRRYNRRINDRLPCTSMTGELPHQNVYTLSKGQTIVAVTDPVWGAVEVIDLKNIDLKKYPK